MEYSKDYNNLPSSFFDGEDEDENQNERREEIDRDDEEGSGDQQQIPSSETPTENR